MSEAIASFAVWSGCRPPKRKTPSGRTASARGWSRSAPPMSTASAPFLRPRGSTITGRRRPRPKSGSRLCERAGAKRCHHACWPCSAARWIASNWFQRQIKEVEAAREAVFHVQPVVGETPCKIHALAKLRGIGPEFATVLATEVFYRRFENRRQLAAFVGLTPSPYMSGDLRRDQGISKAGEPDGACDHAGARLGMADASKTESPGTLVRRTSRRRAGPRAADRHRRTRSQAPGGAVALCRDRTCPRGRRPQGHLKEEKGRSATITAPTIRGGRVTALRNG